MKFLPINSEPVPSNYICIDKTFYGEREETIKCSIFVPEKSKLSICKFYSETALKVVFNGDFAIVTQGVRLSIKNWVSPNNNSANVSAKTRNRLKEIEWSHLSHAQCGTNSIFSIVHWFSSCSSPTFISSASWNWKPALSFLILQFTPVYNCFSAVIFSESLTIIKAHSSKLS